MTLVVPYLSAKLAHGYPSLGLLVNFHLEHAKRGQQKGAKYWKEHGDSYIEWLGTLNCQDDQEGTQIVNPGQPALCLSDGPVEEGDSPSELKDGTVNHTVEGDNLAENETQV